VIILSNLPLTSTATY